MHDVLNLKQYQFTRNEFKKQNSNQQNHINKNKIQIKKKSNQQNQITVYITFFNHYRCHKRKSKSKRCSLLINNYKFT